MTKEELEDKLLEVRSRKFSYIESMRKLGKSRNEIENSKQYQKFQREIVTIIHEIAESSKGPFPDHFPKISFYSKKERD